MLGRICAAIVSCERSAITLILFNIGLALHAHVYACVLALACRMSFMLRLWHAAAFQRAMLLELLAGLLHRHQLRLQERVFVLWRGFLLSRVAKRMNALSALLQWEQSMTRRALRVWMGRTAVWRYK